MSLCIAYVNEIKFILHELTESTTVILKEKREVPNKTLKNRGGKRANSES